jgi:hypothetical protein
MECASHLFLFLNFSREKGGCLNIPTPCPSPFPGKLENPIRRPHIGPMAIMIAMSVYHPHLEMETMLNSLTFY